ncbi:MAG: HIT domain-containing protein [Rickettsiales bacterium]|jgi:diadenosine tetraphosphate (Ap4A) HIT family hydrolase|nr:HIT domain-containing protein [Rickettsiales bacterium]
MYDKNNIFAKIIRGEIPTKKIYENEYALAFHDVSPVYEHHILVLPKHPSKDILDFMTNASTAEQAGFWEVVNKVVASENFPSAYKAIANTGAPYQSVLHFHLHLVGGKKIKNPENSAAV